MKRKLKRMKGNERENDFVCDCKKRERDRWKDKE